MRDPLAWRVVPARGFFCRCSYGRAVCADIEGDFSLKKNRVSIPCENLCGLYGSELFCIRLNLNKIGR